MNPAKLLDFIKKPRAVPVASWHTHPGVDPNLSEQDYAGFLQWPDWDHYIVGVRAGVPTVVRFQVENGVILAAGEIQ